MDEFYTIDEVAKMFKVTRTTVYEWMRSGELPYVQVGARRRVTRSALQSFVKAGQPQEFDNEELLEEYEEHVEAMRNREEYDR